MPIDFGLPKSQRDSFAQSPGPGSGSVRTPFVDLFIGSARIPLQGSPTFIGRPEVGNLGQSPENSDYMLVDFNYKISTSAGVGNEVSITILDPHWDKLEEAVSRSLSQSEEISFQFGWRGIDDRLGRNVNGMIVHDYTVSYVPFQGSKVSLLAVDKNVQLSQGRRTKSFSPTLPISEVIRQVYAEVDPSIVVKIDPIKQTLGEEHRYMVNMTPLEYIKELLKIANSPRGSSKYSWVTEINEAGVTTVSILADNPRTTAVRQYLVGRDRMGEMIEFSPQVLGSVLLTLGGGRADAVSVDPQTGTARRVSSTQDEVGPTLGDKSVHKTPDKPMGVHELPYTNIDSTKGHASEFRARADNYMNNATAVVWGDSRLKAFDQIDVLVLKSDIPGTVSTVSDSDLVHTSGVYRLYSVEHTISAGIFRTMLEMYRESSFIGSKENSLRLPISLQPDKEEFLSAEPTEIDPVNG